MTISPRDFLDDLWRAAVAAAAPARCVGPLLPPPPARGRVLVVGAGKAAAAMAAEVEKAWPDRPLSGLVLTRYGHGVPCRQIEVVEAGHPVPDRAGHQAALRILDLLHGREAADLVLCLISGGASALLAVPAPGIGLAQKQALNRALLRSGAAIGEMNTVRKHLSAIKGGRLALAAAPARVVSLIISDVPGDDPAVIGSGPTVADPTSCADALAILEKYRLRMPPRVEALLRSGGGETPKPGDPRLAGVENRIIATPQDAIEAAAAHARAAGVTPVILGSAIEGEAREVALVQAGIARQCARFGQPAKPPCVLLSGGETTVTLRGGKRAGGRGGRNSEFLLALALALDGHPGIHAAAIDTDGIDGSEENAGARIAPDTLSRLQAAGIEPRARLADHDSFGAFASLGDLIVTGPTRTNVNDFRAILIEPASRTRQW